MLLNIPLWFVGIIGKPPPLGGLPNPHGTVCCWVGAGVSGCVGVIPSLSLKTEDQIEFPGVVCVVGVVGVVCVGSLIPPKVCTGASLVP